MTLPPAAVKAETAPLRERVGELEAADARKDERLREMSRKLEALQEFQGDLLAYAERTGDAGLLSRLQQQQGGAGAGAGGASDRVHPYMLAVQTTSARARLPFSDPFWSRVRPAREAPLGQGLTLVILSALL